MDLLLEKFFEKERWERAIDVGVGKHINKATLRLMTSPSVREELFYRLVNDQYDIAPPHVQLIPKDKPGEFREVMICEDFDRVVLSIINNLFFEMFPEMIHPSCKSYQTGIGCGKVVKEASEELRKLNQEVIGRKYDLTKYFDSVEISFIDEVFDRMERKVGHSKIIEVVRKFYHSDLLFEPDGTLTAVYKSMKQGTATSSFLANAVLYDVDEKMSSLPTVRYYRYSDDILLIGKRHEEAHAMLSDLLAEKKLILNPKKTEVLRRDHWFKFLGFNLSGDGKWISLSKSRIKKFQKEIENRTIKSRYGYLGARNAVLRYLYKGEYSWARGILPIVNCENDLAEMNLFVMDCLRAVQTNKRKVGGLGCTMDRDGYTILRGTGKNVTANRKKTGDLDGYYGLICMRKALLTSPEAFRTLEMAV